MRNTIDSRARACTYLAALCLFLVQMPLEAKTEGAIGKVNFLEGKAFVQRAGTDSYAPLTVGAPIYRNDRIRTSEASRLEIRFNDGSVLRLAPNTQIRMRLIRKGKDSEKTKTSSGESKRLRVKLLLGKVWSVVNRAVGQEEVFRVQTPNAVAGVRGTRFQTTYSKEQGTGVKVYDGKVLVSNKPIYAQSGKKQERVQVAGPVEISKQEWSEIVAAAMEHVRVLADGTMSQKASFSLAKNDLWESWNLARDKSQGLH